MDNKQFLSEYLFTEYNKIYGEKLKALQGHIQAFDNNESPNDLKGFLFSQLSKNSTPENASIILDSIEHEALIALIESNNLRLLKVIEDSMNKTP